MKDATKKKILDVCLQQFGVSGMERTRVEEIVEGAGISRATFYNYFHSKEEAFFCLTETEINKTQTAVEEAVAGEPDPYGKIKVFFLKTIHGVQTMARLLNIRPNEFELLPAVPRRLIESSKRRGIKTIVEILDYGVRAGAFMVSDLELTACVIMSSLDVYVSPITFTDIPEEGIEESVDRLLEVLYFGFSKKRKGSVVAARGEDHVGDGRRG
jgi:TetR/AcrR family fatty acid metabolism transcriptional regulator